MAPKLQSRFSLTSWLYNSFQLPRAKPFSEMGTGGTSIYGGHIAQIERSSKWIGTQKYITSANIATNVSIVAAGVHYFLNLVAHPKWTVKPASGKSTSMNRTKKAFPPNFNAAAGGKAKKPPGSKPDVSGEAQKLADFVQECMENVDTPWPRIVRRAGMYRFYGFGLQEWIMRKRADGQVEWKDVEPRPQFTVERWAVDEDGQIEGIMQRSPQTYELLPIPRKKLVYLVDDTLSDSPEGLGLFRHLAEPYERLKRYLDLEAKGFERDLRGTPIGRAPYTQLRKMIAASEITKEEADKLLEGIEAFVTAQVKLSDTALMVDSMPYENAAQDGMKFVSTPQWGIELLQGGAAGLSELNVAVDRIQREMARILGVEHLMMGDTGGSRATAVDKSRNLYLIANAVLSNIAAQFNKDLIEPLWTMNGFDEDLMPTFEIEDVAFKDVAQVTQALQQMATAGAVLSPDDPVIDDVRDLLGVSKSVKPTPEQLGMITGNTNDPNADPNAKPKPGDPNFKETSQSDAAKAGTEDKGNNNRFGKYDEDQPRDDHGMWTTGGDVSDKGEHPGKGYSHSARVMGGKIYTNNVNDAVKALFENKQVVLKQPRQVSTLLSKLRAASENMIRMGENAPTINLCNVSVPGTNLFCAESKGLSRIQMPQLNNPQGLLDDLRSQGVKVSATTELASYMRATQNELNGVKVAGIAEKIMGAGLDPGDERLFISRDNYIVDGHHRWAATIGVDALDGHLGDIRMKVYKVDMDILPLLREAEKFSGEHKTSTTKRNTSEITKERVIIKLRLAA